MTTIISIDPGLSGAICITRESLFRILPMPTLGKKKPQLDIYRIKEIICDYDLDNTVVIFEKLGQIFKSSKATAFSMGYQSGVLEALCVGLGVRFYTVVPKDWQSWAFSGMTEIKNTKGNRDTKSMSILACKKMIVNPKLTFGDKATKDNDNISDAILLGEYARRKLNL